MLRLIIKLFVTLFVVLPVKIMAASLKFLGLGIKALVWLILLPIKMVTLPFRMLF